MNKKLVAMLSALSLSVSLTACSNVEKDNSNTQTQTAKSETSTSTKSLENESVPEVDTFIKLSANTTYEGSGVEVNNNKITINKGGTYSISGTIEDGQIIVDAGKEEKVYLILNGANITCLDSAPIYIKNAEKAILVLEDNTENNINDTANYVLEDQASDEPNAAIFSKDDLTIIGNGNLNVNGNYNHGIVSKDNLKIQSGNIVINSINDGIKGKDCVNITDGNITITSNGDGIQSNNDTDETKGYIYIEGGKINIKSGEDGIQANTELLIDDGDITIETGEGSKNTVNSNLQPPSNHTSTTDTSTEEEVSKKALKAGTNMTINGGNFNIDSEDDSIHSNSNIIINSGVFELASGDDGIHSDNQLDINGGEINISKSYEGIESSIININDGEIHLIASDDGINAAGGNDVSAETNMAGNDRFSHSSNGELNINGGYLYVDASGDGLDANGSITMTNGTVLVNGPVNGGNGSLDYDGTFDITGGILVAAGSIGMAQTPSQSSTQKILNISLTSQEANTVLNVSTSDGKEILTFAPSKVYQSVIISTPSITDNSEYTVSVGGSVNKEGKDGLFTDITYTGGTSIGSQTISGTITNISQDGVQTNNMGGQPGGKGQGRVPGGNNTMPNREQSTTQNNEMNTTEQ